MFTRLCKIFHRLPEKLKFLVVGGVNTALGYLLFLLMYALMHTFLSYQVIFALSYVISITIAFINFKLFVFTAPGKIVHQISKASVSYVVIYLLNTFCLWLFVEQFCCNPYVAQTLCVTINAVASYCLHKYFSFRTRCEFT